MNVYIESNFILELALEQEQYTSCRELLALGERRQVQLILPAFAVAETYEAMIRRSKNREALTQNIVQETQQLSRSRSYKDRTETLQIVTSLLAQSIEEDKERLNTTLETVLRLAETIPLSHTVLASATQFQKTLDLLPQDSLIYASVLEHLQASEPQQHCFLNRNFKDFDDPEIIDTLETYDCKMLFNFMHGANYIRRQIQE